jgi:hypothetical protein
MSCCCCQVHKLIQGPLLDKHSNYVNSRSDNRSDHLDTVFALVPMYMGTPGSNAKASGLSHSKFSDAAAAAAAINTRGQWQQQQPNHETPRETYGPLVINNHFFLGSLVTKTHFFTPQHSRLGSEPGQPLG